MKTPLKVDKEGNVYIPTKSLIIAWVIIIVIFSLFYYKRTIFDAEMEIKVKKMQQEAKEKRNK
ncbi:MAG: hypothetical protein EAZ44_10625 [Cytophagia bacterium]|nr:MAG: hypothetical protein EAZ44_10625 [Cytophagia bacterium]TAG46022.1 MAG: hypothetical protein EAZ31_00955 [Cytophagia bacterium]